MRLVLFFSRGMSLEGWRQAGILDRELALYRALRPSLTGLTFVTYGGVGDEALAEGLPDVEVLTNRRRLPPNLYSLLAPLLHWRALRRATVFKANQFNGAWTAAIAAAIWRVPLIARSGFLWSDFVARLHPGNWRVSVARHLEGWVCRRATVVVVATSDDRDAVCRRHGVPDDRVSVIANYVDTSTFRPLPGRRPEPSRLLCVARFDHQKNLPLLLEALAELPTATLDLVGDGPDREALIAQAATLDGRVRFLGRVPHAELPALINEAAIVVMPSHYEGHPKAVLEAMACGAAVVATRVPGLASLVRHDETGLLCEPTVAALRDGVRLLLHDAPRRARLGAAAMAWVREHCGLEAVVRQEWALLQRVAEKSRRVGPA